MTGLTENFKLLRKMNWLLNAAVVALLLLGIAFVYSASYTSEESTRIPKHVRHVVYILVGVVAYLALAVLDYRWWVNKLTPWIYGVTLVLLVGVLFGGVQIYGARRWIQLPAGVLLQPSEFAKLACVLALAKFLGRPGLTGSDWRYIGGASVLALLPLVLILKEPDLGTAMILVPVTLGMLFVAGLPWRAVIGLGLTGTLAIGLLAAVFLLPEKLGMEQEQVDRTLTAIRLQEHQKARLMGFFQPDKDPRGKGWNKEQNAIAIGSGGATGKGFLKGTQNILRYLPKSVAPTDFIYAVIAEEMGFLGSVVVLFFFGVIIFCGMQTAFLAPDKLGHLLCAGVVVLLFSHVFINIAMTAGLLPIKGLPLPLLSYGGSFMVVTMSALGIVQSVYIRSRRADFFQVV